MRFNKEIPVDIVMLGAGGTGAHAAPNLYRMLHTLDRNVSLTIVDGDTVSENNLVRQNFIQSDLGKNKARVLAERYAGAFGMEATFIPDFIEDDNGLKKLVSNYRNDYWYSRNNPQTLNVLIGCVDNNKSRQMCHRIFMESKNLIYIDSGNGEYSGQVICGVRRGGKTMFKPIGLVYPDILEETDKFPSELSCAEAAVSAPQSIAANIMAATAIISYIYSIVILGEIKTRYVHFSTTDINIKPTIKKAA